MNLEELLGIVTDLGAQMLWHGAEIHRVEDTVGRISATYGVYADVFAIPSSLTITLTDSAQHFSTRTRRLYGQDVNLDRVEQLNALARYICAQSPTYGVVEARLAEIRRRPVYGPRLQIAFSALTASAFALLFGGGLGEAVASLLLGSIIRWVCILLARVQSSIIFINIVGGAISALGAMTCVQLAPGMVADSIIISTLMLLVPGLTFTNALRDLIAGDLITGIMKLAEALLVASGIAIGVMLSLAVWRHVTGGVL
ncbi:MAG: threonine/serine exporter family protein [Oscillospiraceae bacterium]